jgi:hypothetical protein
VRQGIYRVGPIVLVLAGLCLPLAGFGQGGTSGQPAPKKSRHGGSSAPADLNAPIGIYPTSHGVLKSISGSQLLMEVDDEHEMKFRITHSTKSYIQSKDGQGKNIVKEIKTSSLQPGQTLDIDMKSSLDGAFEAVRIMVVSGARTNAEPQKLGR